MPVVDDPSAPIIANSPNNPVYYSQPVQHVPIQPPQAQYMTVHQPVVVQSQIPQMQPVQSNQFQPLLMSQPAQPPPQQQQQQQKRVTHIIESSPPKYSYNIAWIMWCLCWLGLCGIHRCYLNKWVSGILCCLTGGLCGCGQLIDACFMDSLVRESNAKADTVTKIRTIHKVHGGNQNQVYQQIPAHPPQYQSYQSNTQAPLQNPPMVVLQPVQGEQIENISNQGPAIIHAPIQHNPPPLNMISPPQLPQPQMAPVVQQQILNSQQQILNAQQQILNAQQQQHEQQFIPPQEMYVSYPPPGQAQQPFTSPGYSNYPPQYHSNPLPQHSVYGSQEGVPGTGPYYSNEKIDDDQMEQDEDSYNQQAPGYEPY